MIRDKRGQHLALSLERLSHLSRKPIQRIGLSATMKPLNLVQEILNGANSPGVIVSHGPSRALQLELRTPPGVLGDVCTHEQWEAIYRELHELAASQRTTLIFVTTRRLAERMALRLSELIGPKMVASHHGSLSRERRFAAEDQLKRGELKVLIATASLEMGIDVGFVDQVVQMGSPRQISAFLQRIGRSGHGIGKTARGICYALTQNELAEIAALFYGIKRDAIEELMVPRLCPDVLLQQMAAEVSAKPISINELYAIVCGAHASRSLTPERFEDLVTVLSEGFEPGQRRRALITWDKTTGMLYPRPSSRARIIGNSGTIPETFDYPVVDVTGEVVGSVNEDFAVESNRGDVFALGNTSWQIEAVRQGKVLVHDAHGAPPTIPFWLGEAGGRSSELSDQVSKLREIWNEGEFAAAAAGLGLSDGTMAQLADYFHAQSKAMGFLPTAKRVVFEHFFDASGGSQLVVHAPFGARINRAWALALRKRFCRNFNFELEAAAVDDGFLLSLGAAQSVNPRDFFGLLTPTNVRHYLEQALLDSPIFQTRWRWVAARAVAVARSQFGKKVAPALQRIRSDDLLTSLFPMATACLENITGDIALPEHPLVKEAMEECLFDALDLEGLIAVLKRYFAGTIVFEVAETAEPSPFAEPMVQANPYAFLDDEELQNRRVRSVVRQNLRPSGLSEPAKIEPSAHAALLAEIRPIVQGDDELRNFFAEVRVATEHGLSEFVDANLLANSPQIVGRYSIGGIGCWVEQADSERIKAELGLFELSEQSGLSEPVVVTATRGWLMYLGTPTAEELSQVIGVRSGLIAQALGRLRAKGEVFEVKELSQDEPRFALRHILYRLRTMSLSDRRQSRPLMSQAAWQECVHRRQGLYNNDVTTETSLFAVVQTLQGRPLPAALWEQEILPARFAVYSASTLDHLCSSGQIGVARFGRFSVEASDVKPVAFSRLAPLNLFTRADLAWLKPVQSNCPDADYRTRAVLDALAKLGRSFAEEIQGETGLLAAECEETLTRLLASGLITTDSFRGIRALVNKKSGRKNAGVSDGRWSLLPPRPFAADFDAMTKSWAKQLLRRYGVVFRSLVELEPLAPSWGALRRALHLLELSGEIQGGRFVEGTWGEQYAAADFSLGDAPQAEKTPTLVIHHYLDPANLLPLFDGHPFTGTPERLAFADGRCIAALVGGELIELAPYHGDKAQLKQFLVLTGLHSKRRRLAGS